jgi:hypothetical protein
MKFLETHFDEYIGKVKEINLHPRLQKIYERLPKKLSNMPNLIFYGPYGIGKYSQMLFAIHRYSSTELKYEKKLSISYDKKQYFFKISDIHFEVDFALLGCNSKMLWHEIYQQVLDVLSVKQEQTGIIVCKNFHCIQNELLENFYSYMADNNIQGMLYNVKFIFLCEAMSFLPNNILNCCEVINVSRPTRKMYAKIVNEENMSNMSNIPLKSISNIKCIHTSTVELMTPYKLICDKIITNIVNIDELNFLKFRDMIYDLFIYDLNIYECIWYILTSLIQSGKIKKEKMPIVMNKTYLFFKYYNNNYRPIYHLESYLFYLTSIIYEYI